jgi:ubiquinone/menaquinone biosynthesis C-methylase UbiE
VIEILVHDQTVTSAPADFNQLARIYRWMEWLTFGPFLQRCRCSFLSSLGQRRLGLILGDGDGRFIARLIQADPIIKVDAVDVSQAMLHQLERRADSSRVRIHLADIRSFQPPQPRYDLIATHFFLDCLNNDEVRNLATLLRHYVGSDARWLISEFRIPSNLCGRLIARPLISGLYFAFGLLTNLRIRELPNHREALSESGWNLMDQQQWLGGLLISELWQPTGDDPGRTCFPRLTAPQ